MARISRPRMNIHPHQLILKTVILNRLRLPLFLLFFRLSLFRRLFFLLLGVFALFAEDFVIRVWLEIQHGWELHQRVDFNILESLERENDTLQVDDQHVGRL